MKREIMEWVFVVLIVGQLVMSWGFLIRAELKIERLDRALANHAQVISQMLQQGKK